MKHFILATAGHVDHGKTALVHALTGTDTDRLPEEKARGITIELGFAQLSLPGASVGVIDVPGHEDFVRNMIAGIGSIDLALLVIAADDGWMPQTEEHLQILEHIGVARLVVALTKCDLVPPPDVRAQLAGTRFAEAPIVCTSTRSGDGIDELKAELAQQFAEMPAPRDDGKPRLFVDRVFTARGSGTVVTGTLSGGRLQGGQGVVAQPDGLTSRIRTLQNHNQPVDEALPGMRTALNLADVSTEQIARGDIITAANAGASVRTIDVHLTRSARLPPTAHRLRSDSAVHVHYGSTRVIARVTLLDAAELRPGERGLARLRCEQPVFVFAGDHFIVRDSSEQQTLAGGVVLDPDADGHRLHAPSQRQFLEVRAVAPDDCATLLRSLLERDHFAFHERLLQKSRCRAEDIAPDDKRPFVADPIWWRAQRERAVRLVDEEHRLHADRPGVEIPQWRAALDLPTPLAEVLLAELCADGFTQVQNAIARVSHRPSLPPALRTAGERIRAALAQRPLDPPGRKELAPEQIGQQALRFLLQTNEAVALNEELVVSAAAFAHLKAAIVRHLRVHGSATAGELRQAAQSTRRIMIPLLERLDRDGLTTRVGDRRRLR